MVFERNHEKIDRNVPVGPVAGADSYTNGDYYNNTNASGYINRKRISQRRKELALERMNDSIGEGCHRDPPPEDYFDK